MWKYSLNSRIKFECPVCWGSYKFVKYVDNETGKYIEGGYGRCDREETCGYHKKPENNYIISDSDSVIIPFEKNLLKSDNLDKEYYLNEYHNLNNIPDYRRNKFLNGLLLHFNKKDVLRVFNEYKLGTFYFGEIIYPYYFNDELKTGKIMKYKDNLHRDKDYPPKWLHSWKRVIIPTSYNIDDDTWDEKFNKFYDWDTYEFICNPDEYGEPPLKQNIQIPLFGWDLLKKYPDKTICLVESEKTAVICSIVFPEFNWLSTGGKNFLQPYKFPFYNGRKWLLFPDLGQSSETGLTTKEYWIKKVKSIKERYDMFDYFIDYLPPFDRSNKLISELSIQDLINKGGDISDFILDYKFGCGEFDNYISFLKNTLEKHK